MSDPHALQALNDIAQGRGESRVIEASAETVPEEEVAIPRPRPVVSAKRKVAAAKPHRAATAARRSDSCGSYRAVWYTTKDGRRRYRCVKAG